MIYLELFLTFLQIGALSFGGGYSMISLIREKALLHNWMTNDDLLNMIAVSESTPGPIAVNMATFVGASKGGVLGAILATLGVVLPSFLIILLIATLIRNFLKFKSIQGILGGVRPCVIGLILATAITMLISTVLRIDTIGNELTPDGRALLIFACIVSVSLISKRIRKRPPSPILMILVSAGLGILFYSF